MNIILFNDLPENGFLSAQDERTKHILSVLKLRPGDNFRMGLVNKSEGIATIKTITDEGITFTYEPQNTPKLYPVTMIIAQVRPICMKRILREVVSLGCERIILTGTETGEKSYKESNLYKTGEYKEYLLDGAMQSAHAGLPEVVFADRVDLAVQKALSASETKEGETPSLIVLDNIKSKGSLSKAKVKGPAVLAVGPERGWSDRERRIFENSGFSAMLLGERVLRTETACSVGLAVLLSVMGLL